MGQTAGGGLGSPKAGVLFPAFKLRPGRKTKAKHRSLWRKSVLGERNIRGKAHDGKEPGRDTWEGARGRDAGDGCTLYRAYKDMWEDDFTTGTMGSSGES